jgi:preprotein translocase subunit YajC
MQNVTDVIIMHGIAMVVILIVFYVLLNIKQKKKCTNTKQPLSKSLTEIQ